VIALRNNEKAKAAGLYQQTIEYCKESNNSRLLSVCYRGLGTLAFEGGDFSKAKEYYEAALFFARGIGFKMLGFNYEVQQRMND
jgi:tetratricopeptide (TPR) repeat protein